MAVSIYWLLDTLAFLIFWVGGRGVIRKSFKSSTTGLLWPIVAVSFSFGSTLWMIIPNWQLFVLPRLLIPTLIFSLINSFVEESYWRGLIIDSAVGWPNWLAILYSGALSATNHMFVMVIVPAARNPAVFLFQLIFGVLMGVVYIKTRTLRWLIISHSIVNLLSMSVAMFLNKYVPGSFS